jgi:hypothetical protein
LRGPTQGRLSRLDTQRSATAASAELANIFEGACPKVYKFEEVRAHGNFKEQKVLEFSISIINYSIIIIVINACYNYNCIINV